MTHSLIYNSYFKRVLKFLQKQFGVHCIGGALYELTQLQQLKVMSEISLSWGILPGSLYLGTSFGIVVRFNGQAIQGFSQGKTDSQIDDEKITKPIQMCVGVIYIRERGKLAMKGTGTIVHTFHNNIVPQQITSFIHHFGKGYDIALGIVLTAAHVIRGEYFDNLEEKYFELSSEFNSINPFQMKLLPIQVGKKPKSHTDTTYQVFKDPVTKFTCLHDNDVQILLLVGKAPNPNLKAAHLNFFQKEFYTQHEEEEEQKKQDNSQKCVDLFLVGYPTQIQKVLADSQSKDNKDYNQATICPKLKQKQFQEHKSEILSSIKGFQRNYVKISVIQRNENMVAINGSAFYGMSGGPLCRVIEGEVYIDGILSGSCCFPMLRALRDSLKRLFIQGWGGFGPLDQDIKEIQELQKQRQFDSETLECIDQPIELLIQDVNTHLFKKKRDENKVSNILHNFQVLRKIFQKVYQTVSMNLLKLDFPTNHNICTRGGSRVEEIIKFITALMDGTCLDYCSIQPAVRILPRNQEVINQAVSKKFKLNYQSSKVHKLSDIAQKLKQAHNHTEWKKSQCSSFLIGQITQQIIKRSPIFFQEYKNMGLEKIQEVFRIFMEQEGIVASFDT